MSNDTKKKSILDDKKFPMLIFLIGFALIVGGVLMELGWFDSTPRDLAVTPSKPAETEPADDSGSSDDSSSDSGEGDELSADVGGADFSITNIEDGVPINISSSNTYTYLDGSFVMTVNELISTCDADGNCGLEGDKLDIKFSTQDGTDYPLSLTPANPTANLIDVPVTVSEWNDGYVSITVK